MPQRLHYQRPSAFVLVLTLLLVSLLATTGVGLALLTATESMAASADARTLDHELAVDSLLVLLPQLLARRAANAPSPSTGQADRILVEFADVRVECAIVRENSKRQLATVTASSGIDTQLRELARANGLPPPNLRVTPIVSEPGEAPLPSFLWFDQLIEQQAFEEVFRWRFTQESNTTQPKKVWSDLVSFWGTDGRTVYALEIETSIAGSARRWYVIASVDQDRANVLLRLAV